MTCSPGLIRIGQRGNREARRNLVPLSSEQSRRLQGRAQQLSCTPTELLLAGCAAVLAAWQSREQVTLGCRGVGGSTAGSFSVALRGGDTLSELLVRCCSALSDRCRIPAEVAAVGVADAEEPAELRGVGFELWLEPGTLVGRYAPDLVRPGDAIEFMTQVVDVMLDRELDKPVRQTRAMGHPSDDKSPPPTYSAATPTHLLMRRYTRRERIAAIGGDQEPLSYAQLDQSVEELAGSLNAVGLTQRAVILTPRRNQDFLIALLACQRARSVPAIIDADWPATRRAAAARSVGACCEVGTPPGSWLAHDHLAEPAPGLTRLLPQASHISFTSGTTSTPVATVIGTAAIEQALERYCVAFDLTDRDRVAFLSNPAHDPALRELLAPLRRGATICIPPVDPVRATARVVRWLAAAHVSIVHGTPVLLRILSEVADQALPELRLLVSGGAPLDAGLARQLAAFAPHARLINGYGCTETPQLVTHHEVRDDLPAQDHEMLPTGLPQPGCRVKVCAPDGREVPVGHRGEVWVAAPAVALGYWPPNARPGFVTDSDGHRWFRTGDLARRDAAGALHLEGRLDRQVTVHGVRVELDEIESVARAHPAVTQAFAQLERQNGAESIELWTATGQAGPTVEDIRRHLASVLPKAAVPVRINVVDHLGWTSRMKVSRPTERATPNWTMENLTNFVRQHAEKLLDKQIDDHENFFDAGFDSVALLRYATMLSDELGQPLPPLTLFRYPNLRALVRHLHELMISSGEIGNYA